MERADKRIGVVAVHRDEIGIRLVLQRAALPSGGVHPDRRPPQEPGEDVGLVRAIEQECAFERALVSGSRVDEDDIGTETRLLLGVLRT